MGILIRSSIAVRVTLLASLLAVTPHAPRGAAAGDPVVAVASLGPANEPGNGAAVAVDAATGRVFAAGAGPTMSQISVLDAATGAVVSTVDGGPAIQGGVVGIDVDEVRGRALVLTDPDLLGQGQGPPGRVSVLDARDGRVLRSTVVGLNPRPVALDERHGRYFVLTTDADGGGHVVTVDTVTGRIARTVTIAPSDAEGPRGVALDTARGRLFLSTVGLDTLGYVSVIDTRSGATVRTLALGIPEDAHLAEDERAGHIFVQSGDRVLLLDARDGRAVRTIAAGAAVYDVADDAPTDHAFALTGRNVVLTLDARTGAVLRRTPVPGVGGGRLTDSGATRRVFVASATAHNDGLLSVLDATTGSLIRTLGGDGAGVGPLRAVDGGTGRVFEAAPGPYQGDHYAGPGSVVVRDARTGLARGTARVGSDPMQVAVDARTGAAFVLDAQDDTLSVLAPSFGATPPASPRPTRPPPPILPRTLPIAGYAAVGDEQTSRAFISTEHVTGVSRTSTGSSLRIAGRVQVVDTASGALLRTVDVGGIPGGPGALAVDPVVGRVYVALDDTNRIAVLDARSGAVMRTISLAGRPRALALAARAHKLFIATRDDPKAGAGGMSVLDTWTGAVRRFVVRAGADPSGVAADPHSALVFVTDKSVQTLTVLAADTGLPLRVVRAVCNQPSGVVALAGRAVVLGADGLCTVDGRTGARLRSYTGDYSADGAVVDVGTARAFVVTNSPGFDIGVDVIDTRSGALLRRVRPDRDVSSGTSTSQPVVDEGRGRVYVLLSSPFGRDNALIGPGALAILNAATGALIKDVPLKDTVAGGPNFGIAVDTRLHHLIVMTDNHVRVLDAARL